MILLAIDTSTNNAGIALVRDGATLAELNWQVGQRHGSELFPRLTWLLQAAGAAPTDLTCVAVALGPGSFNGIRVAVATAKALAFALRIPLVGEPTLDCIAWGSSLASSEIWAVLEAGRGQLYAACYHGGAAVPAEWAPARGVELLTPAELADRVEGTALLCGEYRPATRGALEALLGDRVRFASPLEMRRAVWLAELALARAGVGRYDDPALIEPIYVRRPAITASTKVIQRDQARREEDVPGGEGEERALRR